MNQNMKNILLYWNDPDFPPSVIDVLKKWESVCQGWNVHLYSRDTAIEFLRANYEEDVVSAFCACRIPAMQCDFFRVFYVLRMGGFYCDLTFTPISEPIFSNRKVDLIVARWFHGNIVNRLFLATKNSGNLSKIADKILDNVTRRVEGSVWAITGPGVWIEVLGDKETSTLEIIEFKTLFSKYIEGSNYTASTRNTKNHWSITEKTQSIYFEHGE